MKAASASYQYKESARIITSCECSASQQVEAVVAITWSDGAQTFSTSSECSQNTANLAGLAMFNHLPVKPDGRAVVPARMRSNLALHQPLPVVCQFRMDPTRHDRPFKAKRLYNHLSIF